jgi:hypothetical protein
MNFFSSRHEEISNIRVLIANLNGVVAELIAQTIQQQPDIELLGTVKEWNEVNSLINKATIFVLGSDEEVSSDTYLALLNDYPQLKILILRAEGDEGTVYWRTLHCQQMQVISAQSLIESIRQIHSLSPF